jgi:hypothetical protein
LDKKQFFEFDSQILPDPAVSGVLTSRIITGSCIIHYPFEFAKLCLLMFMAIALSLIEYDALSDFSACQGCCFTVTI